MIAYLKGLVTEIEESSLVLEVHDIGYRIFMPASALSSVLREGEEVKIHTYFHVKEDAMQLYGFLTRDDLDIFRLLLGVSGIGPKGALGVLSGLSADDLRFAVLSDDAATIARAPGIGKKTAQKLILELKDKLDLEDAFQQKKVHLHGATDADSPAADARAEAVQALVALGYSNSDALRAVKKVEDVENLAVEEILKQALKRMDA